MLGYLPNLRPYLTRVDTLLKRKIWYLFYRNLYL
jgi:hypothetical protein